LWVETPVEDTSPPSLVILSFNSKIIRWAALGPMPLIDFNNGTFPLIIAPIRSL